MLAFQEEGVRGRWKEKSEDRKKEEESEGIEGTKSHPDC